MESWAATGHLQLFFASLPIATQFHLQKKVASAHKGTVLKMPDGKLVDARDVKNGSGGKRGHRAKNNRLALEDNGESDGDNNTIVVGTDKGYDDDVNEAVKRSLEDSFLGNLREIEEKDLDLVQRQFLKNMENKSGKDVIEIDYSSVEEKKKKNVGKGLSTDMFERVDKKMKKRYSSEMKAWRKIEDSENKLIKKNELKEMK